MTQNQIAYQKNLEEKRSHLAQEDLTQRRDAETARANQAREYETHRANVTGERETNRSNLARELETNRANLESERLKKYASDLSYAGQLYSADRSYDSRIDAAYINKYGITEEDLGRGVTAAGRAAKVVYDKAVNNPVAKTARTAAIATTIRALMPLANAVKGAAPSEGGGHRQKEVKNREKQ